MVQFFIFTFVPVVGLSVAMMLGISNKVEYGDRWKKLTIGIVFLFITGIFITIIQKMSIVQWNLNIILLMVISLIYSLALFFVEYSVHCQRIDDNYLNEDVNITFKNYKKIFLYSLIILAIIVVFSIIRPNKKILGFGIVFFGLNIALNGYMISGVFNFRDGVLRKKNYMFRIALIISFFHLALVIKEVFSSISSKTQINGFSFELMYLPFILLNLIFLIRSYEEYVYFRTKHMQSLLRTQTKQRKEVTKLINKITLSEKKDDSKIIIEVIEHTLNNMKRELILENYGITGVITFRLYNGVFKIDSEDLIYGYCTPLSNMLSIKKVSEAAIHTKLMETTYNLDHIMSTPIDKLTDFGENYLQRIISEKEIVVMDEIPACYKGLQKLIAFVPVFNEEVISGFQVIYKSSYDKLYFFEKKQLRNLSFNLNTIFSIINGKQIQDDRNRLMSEMNIAKEIQTSIIPSKIELDGYDIACSMLTATEVGGDAYEFITNSLGNYLSIADVSGHGLPAGITALIFLASFQGALEASETLKSRLEVDELYDITNKVLCRINRDRIGSDKFMTCNIFREENGKIIHAGAHEVAVQYSASQNKIIEHKNCTEKTAFLGLSELIKSKSSMGEFLIEKDDILVLYTDGVIEAKDKDSNQYGVEKLNNLLLVNTDKDAETIRQLIVEDVKLHAEKGDIKVNNGTLSDDLSLVVIKKTK
jgi:phosphoserine phosphatase RsbU/P